MICNEKNEFAYLPDKEVVSSKDELSFLEQDIRTERNNLLKECDWTQLPDSPLTTEQKEAWRIYRQQLRDIPEQKGFPLNAFFPIQP